MSNRSLVMACSAWIAAACGGSPTDEEPPRAKPSHRGVCEYADAPDAASAQHIARRRLVARLHSRVRTHESLVRDLVEYGVNVDGRSRYHSTSEVTAEFDRAELFELPRPTCSAYNCTAVVCIDPRRALPLLEEEAALRRRRVAELSRAFDEPDAVDFTNVGPRYRELLVAWETFLNRQILVYVLRTAPESAAHRHEPELRGRYAALYDELIAPAADRVDVFRRYRFHLYVQSARGGSERRADSWLRGRDVPARVRDWLITDINAQGFQARRTTARGCAGLPDQQAVLVGVGIRPLCRLQRVHVVCQLRVSQEARVCDGEGEAVIAIEDVVVAQTDPERLEGALEKAVGLLARDRSKLTRNLLASVKTR